MRRSGARRPALTIVGTQDNPSDDVTGGEKAANGLVQRYSNMDAVIGYNDPSALGAVIAARGAGRKVTVVGLNGDSAGLQAVKSGKLAATVRVDPVGWGTQTAIAAYSLITKQNLPLPNQSSNYVIEEEKRPTIILSRCIFCISYSLQSLNKIFRILN